MQFMANTLFNTEVSEGYWKMRLSAPPEFLNTYAGQFVMVRVADNVSPLIRRPLGIMDAGMDETNGEPFFELLYHVVGNGTKILSQTQKNTPVDILGPLGSGFKHFENTGEHWLIGGGIGLPPLYFLAKELRAKGQTVRLFAGGRAKKDVTCIDGFKALGVICHLATEDGVFGELATLGDSVDKGRLTLPLLRELERCRAKPALYTCGPEGMLKAVAKIAQERNLACQVSLENYMACGVGACLGCVTAGKNHSLETPDYRCVCSEGPVFDVNDLLWEQQS